MERFNYTLNNVCVLCRNEEEANDAMRIGTLFGYAPKWSKTFDEVETYEIGKYKRYKNVSGTPFLCFEPETEYASKRFTFKPFSSCNNSHLFRSYSWLRELFNEFCLCYEG